MNKTYSKQYFNICNQILNVKFVTKARKIEIYILYIYKISKYLFIIFMQIPIVKVIWKP